MIVSTPAETKTRLMDAVVMFNDGVSVQRAQIVGVGCMDDDADRVYLHISSLEKFRQQKNGKNPVQWCGWYDIEAIQFAA